MLSKLLKYEIKATARTFLPLYLVLLVIACINRFVTFLSPQDYYSAIPVIISMTVYIAIIIGTFAITLIVMIQRFYKNLLNNEGYLMFTLPVQTWQHIVSKLLVSMMWTVLSVIAAVASVLIIAVRAPLSEIAENIRIIFDRLYAVFGASANLFLLQIVLAVVFSLASNILLIYAAIAIGHLFSRHRIIASIGAYLGIYTITQILSSIAVAALFGPFVFGYEISNSAVPPFVQGILWFSIIAAAIYSLAFYLVTSFILNRRLNLE